MEDSKEHHKILHIITKATWGGAQVYVFDIVSYLHSQNIPTLLVYGIEGGLADAARDAGIPTIHTKHLTRDITLFGDIKALLGLIAILKKERPSVVHIHSSKAGLLGGIAARITGIRHIIFTAHGWPHNESRPEWQKIIFYFLEWLTILFSTKTIAVSETMKAQAPQLFLEKKVVVIKNGVDAFSVYGKENARAALQLSFPPQTFVFGTIAELHKNKGLDVLIKAFLPIHKNYPLTKLCIIGEGEERERLENIINRERLTDSVILLGHVQNAKEFLKAFTVFILPSRTEALGYVLLEAALTKIPCIATRVGGIPEIITHNETGLLVSREDVRELTLGLEFALTHKQEMEMYAKNLYEKVLASHSKKAMLESIADTYSTPKNS